MSNLKNHVDRIEQQYTKDYENISKLILDNISDQIYTKDDLTFKITLHYSQCPRLFDIKLDDISRTLHQILDEHEICMFFIQDITCPLLDYIIYEDMDARNNICHFFSFGLIPKTNIRNYIPDPRYYRTFEISISSTKNNQKITTI